MSDVPERDVEAAEAAVDRQREASIGRIREALLEPGEEECVDCGHLIPEARRRAMPSADRCLPCQSRFERCRT